MSTSVYDGGVGIMFYCKPWSGPEWAIHPSIFFADYAGPGRGGSSLKDGPPALWTIKIC